MSTRKTENREADLQQLRRERLQQFLKDQEQAGRTQREIAARTSVPKNYLTDVKVGRRPLTELYARRLHDEFGVDFAWLLGLTEAPQPPQLSRSIANAEVLPVVATLIEGPPRSRPEWDGSVLQLSGVGLECAVGARDPYALKFQGHDRLGRLQTDDLVLVSQVACPTAQLHVIKLRGKLLLARRDPPGNWQALDARRAISAEPLVIGHAVGILWGRL